VVVEVSDPVVYDTVRDVLAHGGFSLRRLRPRAASLEDVYLGAAGGPQPAQHP